MKIDPKSVQKVIKKKGSTKLFQLLKMGWWGCAKRKEFQSKIVPKATNSSPKSAKNRSIIGPKSALDGPKSVQNRSKIDPGSAKIRKKQQDNIKNQGTPPCRPLLAKNIANVAATWTPKTSQNRSKIDPKIDQFLSCFWDRVWTQNRSKNQPKSDQKSIQHRSQERS